MNLALIIFAVLVSVLLIIYGGYYLFCLFIIKKGKFKVKKDNEYKPKVSIVIPTWNEENIIGGKLKNTLSLKYPKQKLEIIVIDSGSNDKTKEIVRKFKKVKLLVENKRQGKAAALNHAFKHCKGDIVVISDADCRLNQNILQKSIPYFSDPYVGGITGRQELLNYKENLATNTEKTYRDFYFNIREAESKIDSTFIFHGEFSAFRKFLLEDIFKDSVADDSELALRIRRKNYKTLFITDAIYKEYAPNNFSDRLEQKYRRAQGLVQIMFRFRNFFLNPKYGKFGLIIFPVEFFMHIISPFLLITTLIILFFLPTTMILAILIILLTGLLITRIRITMFSFLHSQFACLKGITLYLVNGSNHKWNKISGTRRYGQQ